MTGMFYVRTSVLVHLYSCSTRSVPTSTDQQPPKHGSLNLFYFHEFVLTFNEAQKVVSSDPQACRLAAFDARGEVLWPDTPKVCQSFQLQNGAQGGCVDERDTVALGACKVPALVEKGSPQSSVVLVAIWIERC